MIFEQRDSVTKKFKAIEYKLKGSGFKYICKGFNEVDILQLKKRDSTKEHDFSTVYVEIGLANGKVTKTEIQNQECPERLWFALIPVLYDHQQLLYSKYPPLKWE